ncbi:SCO6881 family protein [Streptomyces niveus]|uniref:ATP-binding protein n=1 Tax=Streptomyces niveus TaxID=193462 RepID=A0A1U9R192_STRNV|nr:ATP-binding protein [Streptomyces niveus]AQU70197.1 ATP-binding protein [Streptomyces niveus]
MGFCDFPLAETLCAVGDAATFASDPGKAIGDWVAKSSGELAAAAADLAATAVNATTTPDLNAGWFRDNYEALLPIGLIVLVATFCAQLVRAAVKRDGQALTQAFTGTISGVLFAFCAIALTTVAIEVVDALSDGLFKAADLSIETAVRRIVKVSQLGALSGLGWMIPSITALGAAIGALMYWCVMMVRKVGILVMVTLAVFAGAGGGWEAARRWRRGWIEATATLVVSKLLMTVIFVLGIAAMGNTDSKDGMAALADVMSGIVIMLLVLLSPYATFKFVHWAAEGTDGESIHRSGGAGAQLAKQHAEKAARKAASLATTAATGGAAAGAEAGAAQGPDPSSSGGGFPGDIAANPTSGNGGQDSGGTGLSPGGDALKSGLEKAVQPAPTSPADEASSQLGGSGASATSGQAPGWSAPPTTAPPPQGAPPSPGSQSAGNISNGGPPPPPTGL